MKDFFARALAVVAIVIAIIGVFTPTGRSMFGTIYDTFTGDYFNATQGFQIKGVTVLSTTTQTNNGVTTTYGKSTLTTATTTPCAILSPAATTTLAYFSYRDNVGTTTASVLTLATSTSAYATTSVIATYSYAANAQVTYSWDPGGNNGQVAPSTYVVVGLSGGVGTFSPSGTCSAEFTSVI